MTDPRITESLSPEVQAEKLRKWITELARSQDVMHADACPIRVYVPDSGCFITEEVVFEITVQPKGLAELQAGLIAEIRDYVNGSFGRSAIMAMRSVLEIYDQRVASLGTGKGGV